MNTVLTVLTAFSSRTRFVSNEIHIEDFLINSERRGFRRSQSIKIIPLASIASLVSAASFPSLSSWEGKNSSKSSEEASVDSEDSEETYEAVCSEALCPEALNSVIKSSPFSSSHVTIPDAERPKMTEAAGLVAENS